MAPARLPGIKACVFDAYGTLFDFASAARGCRDVLGDNVDRVTALWRDKQIQYTWLRAAQGRHTDFWQVTGDALDFTLETLNLSAAPLRERLMSLYLALEPFPDVRDALQRLKTAGMRTAILSNGTTQMLEAIVSAAKLDTMFDAVLSVEQVGVFKPQPESLPTRMRLAAVRAGGDFVPVVERLGCACGVRVRHARRLVQSLRSAPRAAARHARSRGKLARRIA